MTVRFSGAQWRPINTNFNQGGNRPRLYIVHIMEGSLDGTDSWFRQSRAQASSHFGVGKDGTIYQWVETNDTAWHAGTANDHSIGVENAGFATEALTQDQLDANARIYAWSMRQYDDISAWLNTNPSTGSGLSYHGLGVNIGWGHGACPGPRIIDQLPTILKRAKIINASKD